MIRPFCTEDTEAVIQLWLEASSKAHSFLPLSCRENAADMREVYLPLSDEIVVHVDDAAGSVDAFFAFASAHLAALFVAPSAQGAGLGSRLLRIARRMHPNLSLCVYEKNTGAVAFYKKHGLLVLERRVEEKTGQGVLVMAFA